jgi:hypothetical protein
LYEKFRPFAERAGLFSPAEIEPEAPATANQLELFPSAAAESPEG